MAAMVLPPSYRQLLTKLLGLKAWLFIMRVEAMAVVFLTVLLPE